MSSFQAAPGVAPLPGTSIDGSSFLQRWKETRRISSQQAWTVGIKAVIDGMNDIYELDVTVSALTGVTMIQRGTGRMSNKKSEK